MAVSDFLPLIWIPDAFLCFGLHTLFLGKWQDLSCSNNILIINLAKLSDWGMPSYPHQIGYNSIVCCEEKHIDRFQPHNNFPAQSLHFRFGSVAPCPTLKPDVAVSVPRTRYRRLVRPYLIGFSYCIVISLPKLAEFLPLARGNQLCWFRSSHYDKIIPQRYNHFNNLFIHIYNFILHTG